jgi:hypothetical protein
MKQKRSKKFFCDVVQLRASKNNEKKNLLLFIGKLILFQRQQLFFILRKSQNFHDGDG